MPSGRYKTITVSEKTYNALVELAKQKGVSISKAVEILLEEKAPVLVDADKIYKAIEDAKKEIIQTIIQNLSKYKEKRSWITSVKDAFLGKREPLILKDKPITISKAQIFIEGLYEPPIDVSKYNARWIEEPDEEGRVIGISIVPNLSGGEKELEEWTEQYLVNLIKDLLANL